MAYKDKQQQNEAMREINLRSQANAREIDNEIKELCGLEYQAGTELRRAYIEGGKKGLAKKLAEMQEKLRL